MSFFKRLTNLRFREQQQGVVGDHVYSLFNGGVVKQPRELATYFKYYDEDSSVGTSIDALTNMTCGNGLYPSVKDPDERFGDWTAQDAVEELNELNDRIRLDEALPNINKCMRIYGYAPVERVTRRGPPGGILEAMVYDSPSFTYKRNDKGAFLQFIQKTDSGEIKFDPDEIVWFVNKQVGNGKGCMYGRSDVKRVLRLLEIRDATIDNINGILKNQARPPTIWKTKTANDVSTLKTLLREAKEAGEDIVLYPKDAVDNEVVKIDTRIPYWEYVSYIDGLIFQGLHSPMLDYLRNATQASADAMLEVIKLDVIGGQRYLKRMVEHEFWEWHLRRKGYTGPIPSCNFGVSKTGLENLQSDQLIMKGMELGYLQPSQYMAILKQLGISVPDPVQTQQKPVASNDKQIMVGVSGDSGINA